MDLYSSVIVAIFHGVCAVILNNLKCYSRLTQCYVTCVHLHVYTEDLMHVYRKKTLRNLRVVASIRLQYHSTRWIWIGLSIYLDRIFGFASKRSLSGSFDKTFVSVSVMFSGNKLRD